MMKLFPHFDVDSIDRKGGHVERANRWCLRHMVPVVCGLWLLVLGGACTHQRSDRGRVVGVRDGDTIDVSFGGGQPLRVRLFGVDSPEYGQVFGDAATSFTTQRCMGQWVTIEVVDRDKYSRLVGIVTCADGQVLNEDLLASGMAWWFEKFAPDRADYAALEARARDAQIGLWSQPSPQPPWTFREEKRQRRMR